MHGVKKFDTKNFCKMGSELDPVTVLKNNNPSKFTKIVDLIWS